MDRVDIQTGARDQPRDQRVRVPHLTEAQLVATPDRRRCFPDEIEDAFRDRDVRAQPPRALDGVVDVSDDAVLPASDFVPQDTERP